MALRVGFHCKRGKLPLISIPCRRRMGHNKSMLFCIVGQVSEMIDCLHELNISRGVLISMSNESTMETPVLPHHKRRARSMAALRAILLFVGRIYFDGLPASAFHPHL